MWFNKKTLLVFLLLIYSFSILKFVPNWSMVGDGYGYYAYIRSAYFDHDLDFRNEFSQYDKLFEWNFVQTYSTTEGKVGNPWAIGMSIFWIPFFLLARLIDFLTNFSNGDFSGFNVIYQRIIGYSGLIFFLFGSSFLYEGLKKIFSNKSAWISTIVISFTSPLIYYVIFSVFMAHSLSFCLTSLMFWYSIKLYQQKDEISIRQSLFIGTIMGMVTLVRWQDVIMGLLPLGIMIYKFTIHKIKLKHFLMSSLIFFIILVPQLMVWKLLYGSFFVIPQGGGFLRPFHPKVFEVLFSGYHGLFSWTPMLLIYFIGFILSYKKDKLLFFLMLGSFVLQLYLNSILLDWWGGTAFGQRKMICTLFIFAYGMAYILDNLKKKWSYYSFLFVLYVGIFWNFCLMLVSTLNYLSSEVPVTWGDIYTSIFRFMLS